MTIHYNRTGADRKALVTAISDITGAKAEYLGAPTFAYQVDYFTIDRSGGVTFDDRADSGEIEGLIEQLHSRGFESEPVDEADGSEDATEGGETAPAARDDGRLTIQMPLADFTPEALANLTNLLTAKGSLIRKAVGAEDLPVQVGSDDLAKKPSWMLLLTYCGSS